jgi:hypothetical protein
LPYTLGGLGIFLYYGSLKIFYDSQHQTIELNQTFHFFSDYHNVLFQFFIEKNLIKVLIIVKVKNNNFSSSTSETTTTNCFCQFKMIFNTIIQVFETANNGISKAVNIESVFNPFSTNPKFASFAFRRAYMVISDDVLDDKKYQTFIK